MGKEATYSVKTQTEEGNTVHIRHSKLNEHASCKITSLQEMCKRRRNSIPYGMLIFGTLVLPLWF